MTYQNHITQVKKTTSASVIPFNRNKNNKTHWNPLPPMPWKVEKVDVAFTDLWAIVDANGKRLVIFEEFNETLIRLCQASPYLARHMESLITLCEKHIDPITSAGALYNARDSLKLAKGE